MTPASIRVRNSVVGERIRAIRKRRGIPLRVFANTLGISHVTASHYESGVAGVPSERLEQVAAALSVPVTDIAGDMPLAELTDDEVELVRTMRALPAEGRAYIAGLMVDLASGEAMR